MSVTVSKRKKYVRPMTATWWQNWISTKRIWYVKQLLSLLYGSVSYCFTVYFCLASNPVPGLGIVDFIGFLRNPIVVFLNIITLIATLYHVFFSVLLRSVFWVFMGSPYRDN